MDSRRATRTSLDRNSEAMAQEIAVPAHCVITARTVRGRADGADAVGAQAISGSSRAPEHCARSTGPTRRVTRPHGDRERVAGRLHAAPYWQVTCSASLANTCPASRCTTCASNTKGPIGACASQIQVVGAGPTNAKQVANAVTPKMQPDDSGNGSDWG